jgi:hypothetical protein
VPPGVRAANRDTVAADTDGKLSRKGALSREYKLAAGGNLARFRREQGYAMRPEAAQALIEQIIRLSTARHDVKFTLNNGQQTTLRPPFSNVADVAISGIDLTGEVTLISLLAIASVTFPGKPSEEFNNSIG